MAKAQWRQPQRRGILNLFLTWLLFCLVSSENWLISWSQQASENWLIFVEDQFLHLENGEKVSLSPSLAGCPHQVSREAKDQALESWLTAALTLRGHRRPAERKP